MLTILFGFNITESPDADAESQAAPGCLSVDEAGLNGNTSSRQHPRLLNWEQKSLCGYHFVHSGQYALVCLLYSRRWQFIGRPVSKASIGGRKFLRFAWSHPLQAEVRFVRRQGETADPTNEYLKASATQLC